MGTPVVEHGKQRWRTVNGTRTIERTFYQRFWFQRRRSVTAKSLIHKWRRHQSFDPRCTLPRASRGSARHVFLVIPRSLGSKLAGSMILYETLPGYAMDKTRTKGQNSCPSQDKTAVRMGDMVVRMRKVLAIPRGMG